MASVEKDGDQACVKLYCCLIVYAYLELCQREEHLFDRVVENFVELVDLHFTCWVLQVGLLRLPTAHREAIVCDEFLSA